MNAERAGPRESLCKPPWRGGRVQFRLASMLVLTAVVALVLGLLTMPGEFQILVVAVAVYLVLMGVFLYWRVGRPGNEFCQIWRDVKSLSESDDDLARQAALLRRKLEETKAARQGESRRESDGPADEGAEG